MQKKMLYVVFSATPMKIGSMIRFFTGEQYNHISLSFEPKLKTMYSYARYHKKAPLYAGLVKETPARYKNNGKTAFISICAIPVSPEQFEMVQNELNKMLSCEEECRYNILSASLALFSKRVMVPNCYTCVEFASRILSLVRPNISADEFYSIDQLWQMLSVYEVYRGKFFDIGEEKDENYEKDIDFIDICRLSLNGEKELIKAYFNRDK